MAREQEQVEITPQIISIPCKGANPDSQLQEPVLISVARDETGKRLLGCPFIKGLRMSLKQGAIVYFCQAGSPTLTKVLDEILDLDHETKSYDALKAIEQRIPRCFQKYPI